MNQQNSRYQYLQKKNLPSVEPMRQSLQNNDPSAYIVMNTHNPSEDEDIQQNNRLLNSQYDTNRNQQSDSSLQINQNSFEKNRKGVNDSDFMKQKVSKENTDLKTQIINYEHNIKLLKQKNEILEEELIKSRNLQSAYEREKQTEIQKKFFEYDKSLKAERMALQNLHVNFDQKTKECQNLNQTIELNQNHFKDLQKEMQDRLDNFQRQILDQEKEINLQKRLLTEKDNKINELEYENEEKNRLKQSLIQDQDHRFGEFQIEIKNLNQQWQKKFADQEIDNLKQQEDIKKEMNKLMNQVLEAELKAANAKFDNEKNGLNNQIKSLRINISDLENKNTIQQRDIDRQNQQIIKLTNERDDLNRKEEENVQQFRNRQDQTYVEIEKFKQCIQDSDKKIKQLINERNEFESQTFELRNQVQEQVLRLQVSQSEIQQKDNQLEDKSNEIMRLEFQLSNGKIGTTELNGRIQNLQSENERLKSVLHEKNAQNLELDNKGNLLNSQLIERDLDFKVLQDDINRLNQLNQELQKSNKDSLVRIQDLQHLHAQNLEELKKHYETLKQSQIQKDLLDLINQHNKETNQLQETIKKLDNQITQQYTTLQELQKHNELLERQKIEAESDVKNLKLENQQMLSNLEFSHMRQSQIQQENENINILTKVEQEKYQQNLVNEQKKHGLTLTQLERQNQAKINQLNDTIQVMRIKNQELEENFQVVRSENERMNHIINEKIRENDLIRKKMDQEIKFSIDRERDNVTYQYDIDRTALQGQLMSQNQKILDYENKCAYQQVELNRLESLAQERYRENEDWQEKYQKLLMEYNSEIQVLQEQFQYLSKELQDQQDAEKQLYNEKSSMANDISAYQRKIQAYEEQKISLENENRKLDYNLRDVRKQLESQRVNLTSQVTDLNGMVENLKYELDKQKNNGLEIKEQSIKFDVEKTRLQNKIDLLNDEINNKNMEIDNSYKLLQQTKQDYTYNSKLSEEMRKEVQQYQQALKIKESDNFQIIEQLEQIKREKDELKRINTTQKRQLDATEHEVYQKNSELTTKIQEIHQLKERYEQAIQNASSSFKSSTLKQNRNVSPFGRGSQRDETRNYDYSSYSRKEESEENKIKESKVIEKDSKDNTYYNWKEDKF